MSKLSLSRSRGQPRGPITSTQINPEGEISGQELSREELYFQRHLEVALKKSKAEFEKTGLAQEIVSSSQSSNDDNPTSSPLKKTNGQKSKIRQIESSSDESEVDEMSGKPDNIILVGEPSPKKTEALVEQRTSPAKPKPNLPVVILVKEAPKKVVKVDEPVPSTSGVKRPRHKPAKYMMSDSEESDKSESDFDAGEDSDDEFFAGSRKKNPVRQPAKKPSNPPIKKSKPQPQPKVSKKPSPESKPVPKPIDCEYSGSEDEMFKPKAAPSASTTTNQPPPVKSTPTASKLSSPKPSSIPKTKSPAKKENTAPLRSSKPSSTPVTKPFSTPGSVTKLPVTPASVTKPAAKPKASSETVKTPSSVNLSTPGSARPARALIPKWNPPSLVRKESSSNGSSPLNPSPGIGLRVGLSRNFKPFKPLHSSYKVTN